jgi:hypothetical protein
MIGVQGSTMAPGLIIHCLGKTPTDQRTKKKKKKTSELGYTPTSEHETTLAHPGIQLGTFLEVICPTPQEQSRSPIWNRNLKRGPPCNMHMHT